MRSNVIPFPRTRALRVAHRWQPAPGAAVNYCGKPAQVIRSGAASTEIELIHDAGHVYRTWVGTAILKPWKGLLDAVEGVMAEGDATPCDTQPRGAA